MKLNPEYLHPGKHHLCMFCDTPIGKLVDGHIRALPNKSHVLFHREPEGLYTINCCADCAEEVDFKDKKILRKIHANVVAAFEFIDRCNGQSEVDIAAKRKRRLADAPRTDFVCVEHSITERPANLSRYKELLANA